MWLAKDFWSRKLVVRVDLCDKNLGLKGGFCLSVFLGVRYNKYF